MKAVFVIQPPVFVIHWAPFLSYTHRCAVLVYFLSRLKQCSDFNNSLAQPPRRRARSKFPKLGGLRMDPAMDLDCPNMSNIPYNTPIYFRNLHHTPIYLNVLHSIYRLPPSMCTITPEYLQNGLGIATSSPSMQRDRFRSPKPNGNKPV